jgi:murein DD-endopeptidase MepM/ murein hydrolase activator NlpD
MTLMGGTFVAAPVRPVAADDLSDAIARQKALDAQIAKQKAQVAAIASNQKALAATLAATKTSLRGINANLQQVRAEVVAATVSVARSQADVQTLDMQVLKLDQQLADLEATEHEKAAQLDARKAILADRIRQAYDTDRTSLLETFLSGETFTDVLADVSYHLDFAEQDRQLAEQIVADQKVLTVLHLTVESTRTQTRDLRAAADTQRLKLQADLAGLADAQKRLAKLEAETKRLLARQQAAYAQMARDKKKLAATIEASERAEAALQKQIDALVAAQYRGGSIPSRYNGTLAWPMRGTVTQEFGCTGFSWEPRYGSCAHYHNGIDIAAPMYTPIRAAGPGTVLFAGPNPYDSAPKAWIVIIAHSSNLLTWYAHIDNYTHPPAVRAGQHVVKGQVIAYEGMTGHTTGPHLHWMTELNNTFVNPRLFL